MKKILLLSLIFFVCLPIIGQLSKPNNMYDLCLKETSGTSNQLFGSSVIEAGDVNKDGFNDILVSAPGYDNNKGRCYLYYGGTTMDTVADKIFTGENSDDYFGCSISGGDFNDDGYSDLLIGAYNKDSIGAAYLYLGGENISDTSGILIPGQRRGDKFGYSVSVAGDVNGDNFVDFIIGAPNALDTFGKMYVYFGGRELNNISPIILSGASPDVLNLGLNVAAAGDINKDGFADIISKVMVINLYAECAVYYGGSNMDDIIDLRITGSGVTEVQDVGKSISCLGDLNNDGSNELIIGAPDSDIGSGFVYIYYGKTILVAPNFLYIPGNSMLRYFGGSLSSTADVNNDGYQDLIVGESGYPNLTYTPVVGSCYVYYGGAFIDLSCDLKFNSNIAGDFFGCSVAGTDLNNDGYSEVIIGANNPKGDGAVYIYGYYTPISSVKNDEQININDYSLQQNYPNPFNAGTVIKYSLPYESEINITLYNVVGEVVKELINTKQTAGYYEQQIQMNNFASGVYFYRINAKSIDGKHNFNSIKKMILLK